MAQDEASKESAQQIEAKELQSRVESFNKELIPLLGKYELGLGASAFIQPDGRIAARPIMFDARKKPEEGKADAPGDKPAIETA